jgi:hypothetical protein
MKSRSKKTGERTLVRLRKYHGRIPVADAQPARKQRNTGHSPPAAWSGRQSGSPVAPEINPLLNRSRLATASGFENTAFRRRVNLKVGTKKINHDARHVLAGIPQSEIAGKLRVTGETKKVRPRVDAASRPYSDHMFHDVLSVALHALAAKKILEAPTLVKLARSTLERWLSKQQPVPQAFIEWRHILAGTPQEIAAVAMSLTEESTRLRSSSPLGFLLTQKERAAVYLVFGKPAYADRISALKTDRLRAMAPAAARRKSARAQSAERRAALGAFLKEWEKEHGPFTADELNRASKELSTRSSK